MSARERFKELGEKASHHFADESGKEWGLGFAAERAAIRIFDAHPELEDDFRKIASEFLWNLAERRPKPMECPVCKEIELRRTRTIEQGWQDGKFCPRIEEWTCRSCGHLEL
jgi:hypothetical protein